MGFLIIGFILLALLSFIPQWWTQSILKRNSQPNPKIPGTGKEFAQHLIRKHQLNITLEEIPAETQMGDHYDPLSKTVRISAQNYNTNSLTAIATVAHELGHALQDKENYEPLQARTQAIQRSQWLQKFSGMALIATPFLIPLAHTPFIALLTFTAGFIAMGIPVIIHLSTLPVEYDASFNRALPLLKQGNYLHKKDLKKARRILTACALTYVSASLSSLFNLWKWFSGIRR